jgi:hypothetical protein
MRLGDTLFRPVAACGLTAALLACGLTARAQTGPGSTGGGPGMNSGAGMNSGFSPAGGSNFSPAGGNNFGGSYPGSGGTFGGNTGAAFGSTGGTGSLGGSLGGRGTYGGASGGGTSSSGGSGAIVALTYAAVNRASPVPASAPTPAPLPARLRPDLQDLISRSDNISAATRSGLTVGYDPEGTLVLRGTVAGPAEARALESLLRFAPGVSGVRNEMTLRGP